MMKLIASKDNPPYDMFMGDGPHMVELIKAGVVEEVNASDVPNIKRINPGFREFGEYGAPMSIASITPVYSSKYIKEPMTSYSDIARPDLKDRVAIMGSSQTSNQLMLLALAEENGGSMSNMDPAFKLLAAAKPNIVALPSTTVAQQQMYQSEEVYAGVFWDGRSWELRAKGTPIVTVVPAKGIYSVISYVNPVKGTKHLEAAYAYCQQLLSDEGMIGIPQALRYGPTTDIKLPEAIAKELLYNSPERVALKRKVDWPALMANRNAWIERFNKEVRI
jgi:spermidine/putrescine-binding protein